MPIATDQNSVSIVNDGEIDDFVLVMRGEVSKMVDDVFGSGGSSMPRGRSSSSFSRHVSA